MSKLMYKPIRVYKSDINDEVEKLEKKQGVPKGVNSEKHERCVQSVKKDGKDKSSAYAICNASMKKAYSEDINDLVEGKVVKKSLADTLEGLSGEELKKAVENLDDSQKELLKSYLEELAKSKIVTRNGRRFYASGPSKGKEVGTVRGRGGKK